MTPAASIAHPPAAEPHDETTLPELRLLPAPAWEPEYDDERGLPYVGVLPLPPPLRLLPVAVQDDDDDDDEKVVRTPRSDLPAPRPFAQALVQRLLEVVGGVRPVAQMRFDLAPAVFEELERVVTTQPRPTGLRPTARSLRSLHVQERPEGIAEVCATVLRGPRASAFALRLEGLDGAWCCTELVGVGAAAAHAGGQRQAGQI